MASALELMEFLPGTDCGRCGLDCAGFAAALAARERRPEDCLPLAEPEFAGYLEALYELLGPGAPAMAVDRDKCNGCGICVAMCEYHLGNCPEARLGRGPRLGDAVVFKVVNGTVAVVNQALCTRLVQAAERCNKCADHCPTGAITLT